MSDRTPGTDLSRCDYTIEQLKERANYMRGLNQIALCSAQSGHSGGTLSVMDIAAALYLKVARLDPSRPFWGDRDRIIWSAGHKAPALYTALAVAGYFPERELMKLRMLDSPFQGHPHHLELPGVEISSGSLGQGFSVGVGVALAAKLDRKDYRVFVISSDGEQQEGSMWEAAMAAAHHGLDNLVLLIDQNHLQIDGAVADVMNIEPLGEKYAAFGWHVIELDGHDMAAVVSNLDWARNRNDSGKPVVMICRTVKGKGVSFMVNVVGWHGRAPNLNELEVLLQELKQRDDFDVEGLLDYGVRHQIQVDARLNDELPSFSRNYWWNAGTNMKVEMDPTRKGFGRALEKYGDDERVVCLGADISDSIAISEFHKKHPERTGRFISVGVAEQNATTIAAGLAKEGKIPVFGTYGVFACARNLDQLRVSVCYANYNVLVVGAHGGISVGPDGATHQELESIFQISGLPNMHLAIPCDAIETEKMTRALLFDVVGPKYLRFAREATPVVTRPDTPMRFGEANIYRFRGEADRFVDAFEIYPASDYVDEREDVTVVACGTEVAEALRAAWILKADKGLEVRVVNLHTVKPMDDIALIRAARETGGVVTAEEHQIGGLGNRVAGIILSRQSEIGRAVPFAMIGIQDRFGESGKPWQLIKRFGVAAEHIAARVTELVKR